MSSTFETPKVSAIPIRTVARQTDVVDFKRQRRRHEVEARYKELVLTWEEHFQFSMRMLKSEYKMKCHVAQSLRDAQLRLIDEGHND